MPESVPVDWALYLIGLLFSGCSAWAALEFKRNRNTVVKIEKLYEELVKGDLLTDIALESIEITFEKSMTNIVNEADQLFNKHLNERDIAIAEAMETQVENICDFINEANNVIDERFRGHADIVRAIIYGSQNHEALLERLDEINNSINKGNESN